MQITGKKIISGIIIILLTSFCESQKEKRNQANKDAVKCIFLVYISSPNDAQAIAIGSSLCAIKGVDERRD